MSQLEITDKSSKGNYYTTGDTITGYTTGHPYCIGNRLVGFVSDKYGGMLGEPAIEAAEKQGIFCDVRGCNYSYKEHKKETALKVFCKKPMYLKPKMNWPEPERKMTTELHSFLLKLKKKMGKDDSLAFTKEDGETGAQEFP